MYRIVYSALVLHSFANINRKTYLRDRIVAAQLSGETQVVAEDGVFTTDEAIGNLDEQITKVNTGIDKRNKSLIFLFKAQAALFIASCTMLIYTRGSGNLKVLFS